MTRGAQPRSPRFADAALALACVHAAPGTDLEPLAACAVEQDAVVFPEGAWAQERLLPCLAEMATTSPTYEDPPT